MTQVACSAGELLDADAVTYAVPVFKGRELGPGAGEVDAALGGLLTAYLSDTEFKGEKGDCAVIPAGEGLRCRLVLAVGLGDPGAADLQTLREVAAAVARRAKKAESVATTIHQVAAGGETSGARARAVTEGLLLGGYEFLKYKAEPEASKLETVTLCGAERDEAKVAVGRAVAEAVCWTRDLVNEPSLNKAPEQLAARIREMAEGAGIACEIWGSDRVVSEGLGGIAGVGAGSARPPCLVRLEYTPGAGGEGEDAPLTICLVGKGVVFDSGGISIKPSEGMETMKTDMSGAAAVAGTMRVLPALGVRVRVVGFLPLVENLPSGTATRPGDVLRFRNGKTAEVVNTDAEGRLILADALALACELEPSAVVDLATLTGACMVALGHKIFGLMSSDDDLAGAVLSAAGRAGERGWRLPLPPDYKKQLESEVADVKNIGNRYGGALTAGLFLQEFVADGIPWAHLDIAGPARSEAEENELPKGGTGVGVRTLVAWFEAYGQESATT